MLKILNFNKNKLGLEIIYKKKELDGKMVLIG
jgi:hypothetical protein